MSCERGESGAKILRRLTLCLQFLHCLMSKSKQSQKFVIGPCYTVRNSKHVHKIDRCIGIEIYCCLQVQRFLLCKRFENIQQLSFRGLLGIFLCIYKNICANEAATSLLQTAVSIKTYDQLPEIFCEIYGARDFSSFSTQFAIEPLSRVTITSYWYIRIQSKTQLCSLQYVYY